jgi:regulator of protease activity HflC (stomatin/prohibitin superfamily)
VDGRRAGADRDTVPVNIDTIVIWQVRDAERAALKIA